MSSNDNLLQSKEKDYSGYQADNGEGEPNLSSNVKRLVLWWRAGGTHHKSKACEMVAVTDSGGVSTGLCVPLTIFCQPAVIAYRRSRVVAVTARGMN